jgi:hypothetical protein
MTTGTENSVLVYDTGGSYDRRTGVLRNEAKLPGARAAWFYGSNVFAAQSKHARVQVDAS